MKNVRFLVKITFPSVNILCAVSYIIAVENKWEGRSLDIRPGDVLTMKKNHPCGANEMFVIRSGMDFRLRCLKCSREFMVPRNKIEKSIRQVKHADEG